MRKVKVYLHDEFAGYLIEHEFAKKYIFRYAEDYSGESIALAMPLQKEAYEFDQFPPFFEGLLPEGIMLDGLLRQLKIDRKDYLSQLIATGEDLIGAVTVKLDHE